MAVEDVYRALGEDYDEVFQRLEKEERIGRYLNRFASEDYLSEMLTKLEEKDYAEAFRMIHSIKGMGMNIGMSKLFGAADELCEALRYGPPQCDITGMVEKVKKEYGRVIEAIKAHNN